MRRRPENFLGQIGIHSEKLVRSPWRELEVPLICHVRHCHLEAARIRRQRIQSQFDTATIQFRTAFTLQRDFEVVVMDRDVEGLTDHAAPAVAGPAVVDVYIVNKTDDPCVKSATAILENILNLRNNIRVFGKKDPIFFLILFEVQQSWFASSFFKGLLRCQVRF